MSNTKGMFPQKINVNHGKTFDNKFWWIFVGFVLFIIGILFFPYLLTQCSFNEWGFTAADGVIGDTIGGTLGPFIGIGAAILTFLAFWVQYKANEQQKKDLKIERFENKFYELIKLHKENLNEMQIGKSLTGRRCFVPMFHELKSIYQTCDSYLKTMSSKEKFDFEYNKLDLMDLSYNIFFFGIGVNSEKLYVSQLTKSQNHLFSCVRPFLEKIQEKVIDFFEKNPNNSYFVHNLPLSGKYDEKTVEYYYIPFDGHLHRLGHYYRHLFQTADYVVNADKELFDFEGMYQYMKTLRAQLSDFEQLLLYYNAVAWFDAQWKLMLTDFRLIKNMPTALATMHVKPEIHFKADIERLKLRNIDMFD